MSREKQHCTADLKNFTQHYQLNARLRENYRKLVASGNEYNISCEIVIFLYKHRHRKQQISMEIQLLRKIVYKFE